MWFHRHLLQVGGNISTNFTTNANNFDIDTGFPPDLFTANEVKSGAVLLYIIGLIYMIIGWILLYKEYFIPSLFAVIDRFSCTEDVAGGIILAIGILLPDLILEIVSVFVSSKDHGFGKLVGSINFNLLIYLGIAGLTGKNLQLSGCTIARDVTFHFIPLILLFMFFSDQQLPIYENIILVIIYGVYCLSMKFHGRMKNALDKKCTKTRKIENIPMNDNSGSIYPNLDSAIPGSPEQQEGGLTNIQTLTDVVLNNQPLSLKISDKKSMTEKIVFILLFPLIAILWLCMSWFDVRKPNKKKYFVINYIFSCLFMGILAYLVVWWASIIGIAFGIPPEIMGLTITAFGISFPIFYLITKAAKFGCGNLILSMTSGINIFNITIGFALPLCLYNIAFMEPVSVNSQGMICSLFLVILILVAITSFLACFKGRLSTALGVIFIVIYVLFVLVALAFEYDYVQCPV